MACLSQSLVFLLVLFWKTIDLFSLLNVLNLLCLAGFSVWEKNTEKELVELYEAAKKAAVKGSVTGGPEESRCLDALKELQKFPVTYKILVSSQVGKRLRHLTKHPKKKIRSFASDLIEKWKNLIVQETAKNKKNAVSVERGRTEKDQRAASVEVDNISKTTTVKPKTVMVADDKKVEIEKTDFRENVKAEKLNQETKEAMDVKKLTHSQVAAPKLAPVVKCNDAVRDKVRELLFEALSKVSNEVEHGTSAEVNASDPIRVAVSVESVMFDKWGRTNGAQKAKYRSIMFNLKDPKNPDFRRKVLLGNIKPEQIPNLTVEEMASDQRQMENNKIKQKALLECEIGIPPKSTTDQFKCSKCNERKTTYYQLQTRSAEEPMTTFLTCVNCNNHWKFC